MDNKKYLLTGAALMCGVFTSGQALAAGIALPADFAVPANSVSDRGFTVRTAQAPQDPPLANNLVRALHQLNGTLTDTNGVIVANEALPGTGPGGAYFTDTVNFEKDATPFDLIDIDQTVLASFTPEAFPGIPGTGGHTDNFTTEVIGYLDLPAGDTTFGVSIGTDRTDVNNDDSASIFTGDNPHDYFGVKLADFQRSAPPFVSNTHTESQFVLSAPSAGIYPIRLVQWQTSLGSSLTFYTVNNDTGERILVNDANDTRAIKSYRASTAPDANAPYIAEISPLAGSEGISAAAPIQALIVDGTPTVATSDVKLFLNDALVVPQTLTKSGGKITLSYSPNSSRTDKNNQVRIEYKDSANVSHTNSWSFGITPASGTSTIVTGQWDFEKGDLSATVGQALQYLDGPNGLTAAGTQFGTTAALGVPDINGKPAHVMHVPGDLKREIGYIMTHGIAPNGGGTRVNQYTLIMDVMVGTSGPGAASLLQISSLNNTDDGDLFWQGNNFGQGGSGYNGTGAFTPGEWHRVVAAYDEAANPPVVTKYVDGIKQDDWTANQGLDNDRRALKPTAILFGDGDQDERREMWVNSIQIRSGKLTDAEMVLLGGPSADGIPSTVPQSTVTGQWDFDRGDLSATIGKPLTYLDGDDGLTKAGTAFGTTTELSVAQINGEDAKVMHVPGDLKREIGYIMDHGIKPNGGGTRVNQYTLVMDVMVGATGPGAASLLQISSLNNTDDGDLFWQGNNFGQGANGYNGTGAFTPGEWHRVVAAYDEAANPPVVTKFVDGIKQDDWTANQSLDNDRRALKPTAILFGDGDQDERREMWVNSIQIRAGKLSDAEIVLLGGPSAKGIPVAVPKSTVSGQWDFDRADLSATIGKPLTYLDGADGVTKAGTVFGSTTDLGIADIGGKPAKVMYVPGDLDRAIGYVMDHGIAPNGGGTRVNQYTLVMDIMVGATGPGAASLLQISSLNNTDDGDLFWQGNNFGQGANGYNGTGAFTAGEWHRIAAAYDEAANPPVVTKFVDGIKQDDWTANQSLDNDRRALKPTAILFGDGDQDERREMWVNSIQIRAGKLSDAELAALGAPTADGIPVLLSVTAPPPSAQPTLTIARDAAGVKISWEADIPDYTLQTTGTLGSGQWTAVAGVSNNTITVPTAGNGAFYRLIKQ